MKDLKQFILPLKGLSSGQNSFNFKIDKTFFEQINSERERNSEISEAEIDLTVEINKQNNLSSIRFFFEGNVLVPCDRCLEEFFLEIEGENFLYVKEGREDDSTDDIIFLPPGEHQIDLSEYIFEFIHLNLPIKRAHGVDKNGKSLCNEKMLARILNFKSNNDKNDPRWDKLKKLI